MGCPPDAWRRRWTVALFAAAATLLVAATPPVPSPTTPPVPTDRTVVVRAARDGDGGVRLRITGGTCRLATVTLDLTLTNLRPAATLPAAIDFDAAAGPTQVRLVPVDPARPTRYAFAYHARPGCRRPDGAATRPAPFDYALPYPPGEHYRVSQVAFGTLSHNRGGYDEQCVDFGLPSGTGVCAARAGVVVAVRDDSDRGGPLPAYRPWANYVVVRHDDGTCGEYVHLARGSALVRLGQRVRQGQPLGRSGNTGMSTGPHLHLGVFNNVDGVTRVTYPVTFHTDAGPGQTLGVGRTY